MPRRRRAANSVSLFPFLAVLVCAMGALILLLIVTTRRVRSDAMDRAKTVAEKTKPAPSPMVKVAPDKAVITSRPMAVALPGTIQPLAKPVYPWSEFKPVDPNVALRKQLARLASLRDRQSTQLDLANRRLSSADSETMRLRQSATATAGNHQAEVRRANSLAAENEKSTAQMQHAIAKKDELRRAIQRKREDHARASSEFAILPFDGDTGTTRRPIFIECTGNAFRFLPEDVVLTVDDLRGFFPEFNPLFAGTQALVQHWSAKNQQAASEPKPYVMLLVRPSGSTAYYVARKLLKNLGQPIGYELIDENVKVALPDVDPRAQAACRDAVNRALEKRRSLAASIVGGNGYRAGANSTGRSIRFHRGTGRLEVIDPDREARSSAGNGSGKRNPQDPWKDVLEGGGSFPRNRSPRTGNATNSANPGSPTNNGLNREPRRFANSQGTGRGSRGTGRGQFPRAAPSENRIGERGSNGNPGGQLPGGQGNASRRGDPSGQPGTPGSPNGTSENGPLGEPGKTNRPGNGGTTPPGGKPNRWAGSPGGTGRPQSQPTGRQRIGSGSPSLTMGRRARNRQFRPAKKRWGFSDRRATIGFEREVTVQTAADRLVVGNRNVVRIGKGESKESIMRKLVAAIESEARSWGKPPGSFYWVPMLRFVISPGGNQHFQRLREPVHKIGLQSSVEYKLSGPTTAPGRASQP